MHDLPIPFADQGGLCMPAQRRATTRFRVRLAGSTPRIGASISRSRAQGTGPLEIGEHMSLSERLKSPPKHMSGSACSMGALLDTLQGDERAALVAMLGTKEKRGWSQSDIYDALTAEGHEVGRQTINRHRSGACRCAK